MARALAQEGIELVHVIGAKAGHRYTPEAKEELNRRIDSIVNVGRDPVPVKVRFQPGRCVTTARSGFRSTASIGTGKRHASTPTYSAGMG